jgi:uncharacterized protein
MKKIRLSLLLSALLFTAFIASAAEIPYLTGRVTDNAQILSPDARRSLTEDLKAHEGRTGNQIVVLTIPALDGQNIEDYAVKVFEEWKLGQKGKDNGILIVVAPNERRMRIEVGYGLEGTMTDLMAGRIIQQVMTPKFKNRDYDGGITNGVQAVMGVLEGGKLSLQEGEQNSVSGKSSFLNIQEPDLSIMERILVGAFIFGIIGVFTVIGILTPGVGWFLYLFLIPFWAMFPIVVLGVKGAFICLIAYVVLFPTAKLLLRNSDWYKKAKNSLGTKGMASIGGFTFPLGGGAGGGGSSFSGGGGFSGGSSFSGGGGSSGGGGASGGW